MSVIPKIAREPRTDFGPPPPGYIAGIGRGAIGFTTRSDIGPARPEGAAEPTSGAGATLPLGKGRALAAAAALGLLPQPDAPPGLTPQQVAHARAEQQDAQDLSESNFDSFAGYGGSLFSNSAYDAEDKEADLVYDAIERRMDGRRKRQREAQLKLEMEEYQRKRPKVEEQFQTLKRNLAEMKTEDWDSIPEPLDYSRKNKLMTRLKDKFTPLPDSVVESGRVDNRTVGQLDHKQQKYGGLETPVGGWQTPIAGGDLTGLRSVRDRVLKVKLDRMADSVSGQTVVDPKGYLTDLNSIKVNSEAEIGDIKKAKLLLDSVITTNPKHAPGWIAAARLENETGKTVKARQIIMKGCEICPTSEDVWLEAARMHDHKSARAILAKAIRHVPTSVKVWMRAAELEEELDAKKAVLRKALEFIPKSVALWKNAIELENERDAVVMLGRAVELIPESVEMWLALARLEKYEQARVVLNKARMAIPTEPAIWITAAKLEEANGNTQNVQTIIANAVKSLAAHNVIIDRDAWLNEAEMAEKSGAIATCAAIIKTCIGLGVEEQDRKTTWSIDADHMVQKGSFETARAIYAHMLSVFPGKKSVWMLAAQMEKAHGSRESLDALLRRAVEYCPQAEILWLMAAKEKWLAGDIDAARSILNDAFRANPDSEPVWLAAVKLERENKEYERARKILEKARERVTTPKVWRQSARLERLLGNRDGEKALLEQALSRFPEHDKLWIMLAELQQQEAKGGEDAARETFKKAVKHCPASVDLWLAFADLEARAAVTKARSLLETARLKVPKEPRLWLAAIRVEQKADNKKVAEQLMAKALQECPTAGVLWAHAIATDPRAARKGRSYEALKRCSDDPHVFCAVAKLFWLDRKIKKARSWFVRAVTVAPNEGDIWTAFYKFELEHGTPAEQEAMLKKAAEAEPRAGERWRALRSAIANHGLKTVDLLKKAAAAMTDVFMV